MRKTILILIAILLFHNLTVCQWVQQISGVSTSLLDMDFIDQNTGWACGDNGVVVKTTNGGVNWIIQPTGVTKRLEGIDAVDANIIYSVGWFQTIIKSTNSGTNWIIIRDGQISPPDPSFYKCFFLNANTGWLLRSGGGYVLRTSNGGTSFDSTFINHSFNYDVYFKDAMTGVLCGNIAWVMKSTNGGVSWNQILLPLLMDAPDLFRISFIGDNGWTIGAGDNSGLGKLVFRTTNFGTSWDTIARVPYPDGQLNYSVFFSSLNTGYCGGTFGYIFKSTNGGLNWILQNVPIDGFRRDYWFANDSLGWVAGGGGYILKTTNGGTYVAVEPVSSKIPKDINLSQNYPNPFNPITNIFFELPFKNFVELKVYDILGRHFKTLVTQVLSPGRYKVSFDGTGLVSGIYIYRLTTPSYSSSKTMVLIK